MLRAPTSSRWRTERGWSRWSTSAGNVVVRKPAQPGLEEAPGVILQAHLDMVQEKNSDVEHDFATEPIRPVRDGDWLTADGTTLGADNGIGVAAMLAIIEADDIGHGPLEFLFTIDEETGLTGAKNLAEDLLRGQAADQPRLRGRRGRHDRLCRRWGLPCCGCGCQ